MSEERIVNKDCLQRVGSLRQRDWLNCVRKLGFRLSSGGRHPYTVLDPENPNDDDITSLVTTIPYGLHKEMNKIIAKQIILSPITKRMKVTEKDFWKALGLIKK